MSKAKTKEKPLEAVDHMRCQADVRSAYNPWVMGGDVGGKWGRCDKKPTWYAREVKAGSDGRKGAMSLCDTCKVECEKQHGERLSIEPLVGWNDKFHQLHDNPHCVPREEVARILRDAGADPDTAAAFEQLILKHWGKPKRDPSILA